MVYTRACDDDHDPRAFQFRRSTALFRQRSTAAMSNSRSSSDDCIPLGRRQEQRKQLTMFYGGKVYTYNVTPQQAQLILSAVADPTKNHCHGDPRCASASSAEVETETDSSFGINKKNDKQIQACHVALPFMSRNSLRRFFAQRKQQSLCKTETAKELDGSDLSLSLQCKQASDL